MYDPFQIQNTSKIEKYCHASKVTGLITLFSFAGLSLLFSPNQDMSSYLSLQCKQKVPASVSQ